MDAPLLMVNYTLDDIHDAAVKAWKMAKQYRVWAFSGEMGAGKTTFIHALCDHLRVADAVSSPTFALINEYHFNDNGSDNTVYHMDWYRIKNEEEAMQTGMEDCLIQALRGNVWCLVEWPEKAKIILPRPYLWISIISPSPTDRIMTINVIE